MAQSISQEAIGATGLPGATAASRHAGATTSGAPTTGTFAVGDFIVDQSGNEWVCTVAGTPGTWVALRNATQLQSTNISSTAPTSNQVLTYNSGTSSWTPTTPAAGALTYVSSYITSNVNMSAATITNITSASCVAGTWLFTYMVTTSGGNGGQQAEFDLSTTSASSTGSFTATSVASLPGQGSTNTLSGSIIYTLASTTTIYLIGYSPSSLQVQYASSYLSGKGVTGFNAVKIA